MDAMEEYEHAGCTIALHYDEDPMSPREWCNLGVMVCWHSRYDLGDKQVSTDVVSDIISEPTCAECGAELRSEPGWRGRRWEDYYTGETACDGAASHHRPTTPEERLRAHFGIAATSPILPLFLFDHSGLSMSTSSRMFAAMDSHGWDWGQVGLIYATEETIAECGTPPEHIEEVLTGEVAVFDEYLRGEVCGYTVERDGAVIDSCWGFYGDDGLTEAKRQAEDAAEHEERNVATLGSYEMAH